MYPLVPSWIPFRPYNLRFPNGLLFINNNYDIALNRKTKRNVCYTSVECVT